MSKLSAVVVGDLEYRYDYLLGTADLFEGYLEDTQFLSATYGFKHVNGLFYYCERYNGKHGWVRASEGGWPAIVAARMVIETKRWTKEDCENGVTPELGALVCDPGNNIGSFVGAGIHESEPIFFLRYEADRCEFWLASSCKPIETQSEKETRLENEFVEKMAHSLGISIGATSYQIVKSAIRHTYRELTRGDKVDVDALDDLHSQIITIHNEIIAAKPSLLNVTISRQRFETWWQQEMNTEAMPLTRTEYPMVKDEDQQYLCHDTNRGWLTWQANDETNAADTLDAKRYRWLADGYIDTHSLFVEAENKAQLDAAIDESMAECWEAQNKESAP